MASEKEHLRHCILFALQLKKNATEATEKIFSALGEGAVTHKTCKKWSVQRFCNSNFDLSDRERPDQSKKFEDEKLEQLRNILLKRSYSVSDFPSFALFILY